MKTCTEKIFFDLPLTLESGSILPSFELMVETDGELNSVKDNAVLVCHAFSGNHHAAGEKSEESKAGHLYTSPSARDQRGTRMPSSP